MPKWRCSLCDCHGYHSAAGTGQGVQDRRGNIAWLDQQRCVFSTEVSGAGPTRIRLDIGKRLIRIRLDIPPATSRIQNQLEVLVWSIYPPGDRASREWSTGIDWRYLREFDG